MNNPITRLFRKIISLTGVIFVTLVGVSTNMHASKPEASVPNTAYFSNNDVLTDPLNRISSEFKISANLQKRTAFWFDIYTKYGSQEHIIHHSRYPWIVYKVIDVSPILNSGEHRWTKHHKAEKAVINSRKIVSAVLRRLANKKNYRILSKEEREYFNLLSQVKGSRHKVFKEAYNNVRIQLGQKDFFRSGLVSGARYLSAIEKEFADNNLPTDLSRLPFVESSFNIKAQSKVGASGVWQLMPSVGNYYLLINDHIDERNSPLKASLVAIELFKRNYRSLRSWPLTVTAYNHGATGVHRALRAAKATNLSSLINSGHRGSFRFASANFFSSFLAVLHAEKYNREIFQVDLSASIPPIKYHIIALQKPMRARSLLAQVGMSSDRLLEYNLDLNKALSSNALLPRGYRLILPADIRALLKKNITNSTDRFRDASLTLKVKTSG
ncbi:MAG: hypothetical protein A2Z20_05930 [Bdellovibrionales bacterium RBG_16_40_8]|nr:MAG: hypothetical protein A2Z20_05930 [Bdellovibrionales bacterium RBG_16_40_8]